MPGAGSNVNALDNTPMASDTETADELAYNSVPFIPGANQCGTTFTAPTSGRVLIFWGARMQSNTVGARVHVSVSVRTGSTVGAGTVVSAATDDSSIESVQAATGAAGAGTRMQASRHRDVSGLTPGSVYNVQVEHKTSISASGDVYLRDVSVLPVTT
jgi:hypothetical protein